MNRNFDFPANILAKHPDLPQWAHDHATDEVVAVAIQAIASGTRTREAIWDDPTDTEWDIVRVAVEEYITRGDYPVSANSRYSWSVLTLVTDR